MKCVFDVIPWVNLALSLALIHEVFRQKRSSLRLDQEWSHFREKEALFEKKVRAAFKEDR
jgi:hypothetical protein